MIDPFGIPLIGVPLVPSYELKPAKHVLSKRKSFWN